MLLSNIEHSCYQRINAYLMEWIDGLTDKSTSPILERGHPSGPKKDVWFCVCVPVRASLQYKSSKSSYLQHKEKHAYCIFASWVEPRPSIN